jgi:hypothetical protein
MHEGDRKRFVALLTSAMSYYSKDVSDFMLSIYWSGLARFDYEDVSRAFTLHAQNPDNGQWAPKVADIVKLIEGSTATQGMLAWSKVRAAIGSVGRMRSVAFDDALIHAVIGEMGGWYSLCSCNEEELPFKAREFEKRYQGYASRRETPEYSPYLMGGHEADNRLNGYRAPSKPVLIGRPEVAALVMEQGRGNGVVRITDSRKAVAGAVRALAGGRDEPEPPRAA